MILTAIRSQRDRMLIPGLGHRWLLTLSGYRKVSRPCSVIHMWTHQRLFRCSLRFHPTKKILSSCAFLQDPSCILCYLLSPCWRRLDTDGPYFCGICSILQNEVIHEPFTLISCFGVLRLANEPVCAKSNYPFSFSASATYVNTLITHFPRPLPNTTNHIKSALWEGWDSKQGEGQTWKGGHYSGSQDQCGGSVKSGVGKSNIKKFCLEGTEGALRARVLRRTEWRGKSGDIFKPGLNDSRKGRETKIRINLQKEQTKTQLHQDIKMAETLPLCASSKGKTG